MARRATAQADHPSTRTSPCLREAGRLRRTVSPAPHCHQNQKSDHQPPNAPRDSHGVPGIARSRHHPQHRHAAEPAGMRARPTAHRPRDRSGTHSSCAHSTSLLRQHRCCSDSAGERADARQRARDSYAHRGPRDPSTLRCSADLSPPPWRRTTFLKPDSFVMASLSLAPSSPSDAASKRWPVTSTTGRANPLRCWNPDWGGCSTARRPVAAITNYSRAPTPCQAASRLRRPRSTSTLGFPRIGAAPPRTTRYSWRERCRCRPRGSYRGKAVVSPEHGSR